MRLAWTTIGVLFTLLHVPWQTAAEEAAANLLGNGSFEEMEGDSPVAWHAFVMPNEGASGSVDSSVANHGARCVQLSTTTPYDIEPYNNWSQNVEQDLAGKALVARAYVRSVGADGAALWVQCWRKNPWSVIKAATATSRSDAGVSLAWRPVEVRLTVPQETDYVTVRCVLKGTGTVWFDDVTLEVEEKSSQKEARQKTPSSPVKPVKPTPPTKPSQTTSASMKTGDQRIADADKAAQSTPEAGGSAATSDQDTIQQLMNANRVLTEGYKALRETNESLAQQIKALEAEVARLRGRKPGAVDIPKAPSIEDRSTNDDASALQMLRGVLGADEGAAKREKPRTESSPSANTHIELPQRPRPPFVPSTRLPKGD